MQNEAREIRFERYEILFANVNPAGQILLKYLVCI